MSRPSLKRKIDSSFTPKEIELSVPKKICLDIPTLYTDCPSDIWTSIILKLCQNCALANEEEDYGYYLNDCDTFISLSKTCKYFKYILEQPMAKDKYNIGLKQYIPNIQIALEHCNDFFGNWDETKDFGRIKVGEFQNFISKYNYHNKLTIFHRIVKLHQFLPFFEQKQIIEYNKTKEQWKNFLKLCPNQMIDGMKTNIYYKNQFY